MRAVPQLLGLTAAGVLLAGSVEAQGPRHEFGVDAAIVSSKADGAEDRSLTIGAPIDIRIGFVSAGMFSFEPRFSFLYSKEGDVSFTSLTPGVNVLIPLGQRSGLHNQMGPYVTGGVLLDYTSFDDGDEDVSNTQFGLNAGIGTRLGWGNAAFRPELFFAYLLEAGTEGDADFLPSATAFGVRFGVSVWR